jgi:hypothetical protein
MYQLAWAANVTLEVAQTGSRRIFVALCVALCLRGRCDGWQGSTMACAIFGAMRCKSNRFASHPQLTPFERRKSAIFLWLSISAEFKVVYPALGKETVQGLSAFAAVDSSSSSGISSSPGFGSSPGLCISHVT